ncbi:glycosyltransferase [Syntrophomonas wolfei]|uniref:glycosyltransferase n=1 Tax=Syntrophomonas wolfei TaxID=863 RepID=UPI00077408DD|nr:glycosyltransferase [Syntrophomonas wolfei]
MSNINCILYPPTVDFHYLVQRPQHLIKNFSELGVLSFFLNNPHLHEHQRRGIERINPYLFLFNGVEPTEFLRDIRPVVYYSATAHVDMIKKYRPSLVVFDSVDEPSDEFAGWRPYYHRAVATADIVITTSDKLYKMAKSINPRSVLVPNACDYEHFSPSTHLPIPADMRGINSPVIGYIGAIATWVDLELLDRVAARLPHFNFVMLGPLYNVSELPQRPNLHWLGFKDYKDLPAYAQAFDVGLIPFKLSSMTESVNPIKMWEYMAVGMPVVATALPEVYKFQELIYYSENEEEFIENIGKALVTDNPFRQKQRMELARQNSWSARAVEIIDIIENTLAEKGIKKTEYRVDGIMDTLLPDSAYTDFNEPFRASLSPFQQVLVSPGSGFRYSIYPGKESRDRDRVRNVWSRADSAFPAGDIAVVQKSGFRYYTQRHQKELGLYYG